MELTKNVIMVESGSPLSERWEHTRQTLDRLYLTRKNVHKDKVLTLPVMHYLYWVTFGADLLTFIEKERLGIHLGNVKRSPLDENSFECSFTFDSVKLRKMLENTDYIKVYDNRIKLNTIKTARFLGTVLFGYLLPTVEGKNLESLYPNIYEDLIDDRH